MFARLSCCWLGGLVEKWSFIGLVSWLSKRIVRAFRTRSTDSPSIQDKVYGQSEHSGQSLRTVRAFRTKSADSPSFKDKVYRQSEHSGQSLRTVRALRTKSTDRVGDVAVPLIYHHTMLNRNSRSRTDGNRRARTAALCNLLRQ